MSLDVVCGDHLCGTLTNHDDNRIYVSTGDIGHNARICNTQIVDTENPKAGINNLTDAARARHMVDRR